MIFMVDLSGVDNSVMWELAWKFALIIIVISLIGYIFGVIIRYFFD